MCKFPNLFSLFKHQTRKIHTHKKAALLSSQPLVPTESPSMLNLSILFSSLFLGLCCASPLALPSPDALAMPQPQPLAMPQEGAPFCTEARAKSQVAAFDSCIGRSIDTRIAKEVSGIRCVWIHSL